MKTVLTNIHITLLTQHGLKSQSPGFECHGCTDANLKHSNMMTLTITYKLPLAAFTHFTLPLLVGLAVEEEETGT